MMTAFRVILLFCLLLSYFGGIAGRKDEKRECVVLFGLSGALYLLSHLIG